VFAGIAAAAMGLGGGLLVSIDHGAAVYGSTMFIGLPIVTGVVAACFVQPLRASLLATLLSILACFAALLFTGLEGIVCILMAAPLILGGAVLGAALGTGLRRLLDKRTHGRSYMVLGPALGLALIIASSKIENQLVASHRIEAVSTAITLRKDPDLVWQSLIAVPKISGNRPFLLRIGLPVPTHCALEGKGVGAKRICYFESGAIEEEIIGWEPPRLLQMKIKRSTLPGRHWLGFVEASYVLAPAPDGGTHLIRSTTISSRLRPRWYWRPFEAMGVEAEHRYLFESLAAD
jgi:hypothetical protein